MTSSSKVIIVGGGVSGLATAYFLARLGLRSTVFEKSNRLGGLIKTDIIQGCHLEAGPDSYIATKPAVTTLAESLGDLSNQIIGSNDRARRVFVVRRGKLVPLPKGMAMMVPGEWPSTFSSELFSTRTKLRFVSELFSLPRQRKDDVSIQTFVTDHFGREALEYVAEPLLSGVYGGHSSQLSTESVLPRFLTYEREYGSLIRGVRRESGKGFKPNSLFLSFRSGMQSLIDSLTQAVAGWADVLHAEAEGVVRTQDGWRVHSGDCAVDSDQLVLAVPSYLAGQLLASTAPELASELFTIPYSSCILVTLVYERDRLGHPLDGFGFLVPIAERRTIAAATWISTKFPSRVPEGLAALRAFIVDPEATGLLSEPQEQLIQLVRTDLKRLMGIESDPISSTLYKWPKSMPQYIVGHEVRRRRISDFLSGLPDLHLAGNAYDGVGIPDCVRRAEEIAKRISIF